VLVLPALVLGLLQKWHDSRILELDFCDMNGMLGDIVLVFI
jgi:hypothetical protein